MDKRTSGGLVVLLVTFLAALFVFCLERYKRRRRHRGRVYRRLNYASDLQYPGEAHLPRTLDGHFDEKDDDALEWT